MYTIFKVTMHTPQSNNAHHLQSNNLYPSKVTIHTIFKVTMHNVFFSHFYDHFNLSQPFLCGVFFLVSQNLFIFVMAIFKFFIKFAVILAFKLCKKNFFSHFYDHFNLSQPFLCGVLFFWCHKIFLFL